MGRFSSLRGFGFGGMRGNSAQRHARGADRRLVFEPLETRQLLSVTAELVADIFVDGDSNPSNFCQVGDTLFFTCNDGTHGAELWKSDGTEAGTVLVKDIFDGTSSSSPSWLTAHNDTLFFVCNDGTHGRELWMSDGTESGTVLVKDIYAGTTSSEISSVCVVGEALFFGASDRINNRWLWKTDGTESGTVAVTTSVNSPSALTNVNGTLFFRARDSGYEHGYELWKSDGTDSGTVMIKDINPGSSWGYPNQLTNVSGTLFFTARKYYDSYNYTLELWKSDGTEVGTGQVAEITAASGASNPHHLTNVDGTLFFSVGYGTSSCDASLGTELWKSDGTEEGTVMVKEGWGTSEDSYINALTNVNGQLFFSTTLGDDNALWKSDGTEPGTTLIKSISATDAAVAVNGLLFFVANDGTTGNELWRSNGIEEGTVLVADISSSGSSSPLSLTNLNGTLFFNAKDDMYGRELWKVVVAPVVESVAASAATVIDATVGKASFSLTVVFSGEMDTSVAPTISFPVEDPSATLTFNAAASGWLNAKTYVAYYDVVDSNLALADIDVRVTGGVGADGQAVVQRDFADVFSINTTLDTGILGIGVLGDSLSDEYNYDYAENWVQLLDGYRDLNFGDVDSYSEPRLDGYAYNWARYGATTTTLLTLGEDTGLAAQIETGLVTHAVIAIGQNDFFPLNAAYQGIYDGTWTEEQIAAYVETVVSNIETALQTIDIHETDIVLATIIDYGVAAYTQAVCPDAAQRELVTAVIDEVNERLAFLARQYQIPLVDMNAFAKDYLGTNYETVESIVVGGVAITNDATDATHAADHFFVEDGIHPGTVGQALIANLFVAAFNEGYDTNIAIFSEEEILAMAGLTYGGSDTLNMVYTDYVLLQDPFPAVTVTVSPESVTEESGTNLVFTFVRASETDEALTISFDVTATATLGDDYTQSGADTFSATSGTVTFAAGSDTATVVLTPVANYDTTDAETVTLTVTADIGYTLADVASAMGTILPDTTSPTVTITQAFGQSDSTNDLPVNFTVVFSEAVADFTAESVTVGGTAGASTVVVTGSGTTYNVAVSTDGVVAEFPSAALPAQWIGENLPTGYEPSGIVWHERLNCLFLVSDGGILSSMNSDGTDVVNKTVAGDLEGVCIADAESNFIYLGIEYPDSIVEYDLVTHAVTRTFDLQYWLTGASNAGLEALTFVPDPTNPEGGLFYTGLQADGKIYVFQLPIASSATSTAVTYIGMIAPVAGLIDISGLSYDTDTGILYAIYDSANRLAAMTPEGVILGMWELPGSDQEGIAICGDSLYIAQDSGEVALYESFQPDMAGTGTITISIVEDAAHDAAGNGNLASINIDNTVTFDITPPTVTINQAATQAEVTNSPTVNFTVVFSETVTGFTAEDVVLGGTAGANTVVITGSGTTYNVAVSGMTQDGTVTAAIRTGAAYDDARNVSAAATSTDNVVTYDGTAPTATINQAADQPDPTNAPTINFTIVFSEAVEFVSYARIMLSGTARANQHVVTGSGTTYNVAVSGMTRSGTVILSLLEDAAQDAAGNYNTDATSTDNVVTYDITKPTVTINQAATQDDPTNQAAIDFTVVFSEAVADFTAEGVVLSGTAGATTAVVTDSGDGKTYTVTVSGMTSDGTVVASIPDAAAHDFAGNASKVSTSADNQVTVDFTEPTVTINQAVTQYDPTNVLAITYTVVFSEVVGDFTAEGVVLSGTAGATTAVVTDSGDGMTYTVMVSGMTHTGTVVASIDAGAARDAAGNFNTESTSTDNVVTYDVTRPEVTIDQAAAQADPTNVETIDFTVLFSEHVTGFDEIGVMLYGTAGATTVVVTDHGDGMTYTVTVSGMTQSGTVVAVVAGDAAQDDVGYWNDQSTSADNTVLYDIDAPTVTLTAASYANRGTPTVVVSAADDLAGVSNGTLVYADVDLNGDGDFEDAGELGVGSAAISGGAAVITLSTVLDNGTYHLRGRTGDVAGNEGVSAEATIVIDTTIIGTTSIELVSSSDISLGEEVGDSYSWFSSVTADGRYVAFASAANNLVEGDTNGQMDIFVKDTLTGEVILVSQTSDGVLGDSRSWYPYISSDGRYVVFWSDAGNLIDGDTNNTGDIYVKDLQTGAIILASCSSTGEIGNGSSQVAAISDDGRYVTFGSYASNLVAGDTNNTSDIFVKDLWTGEITRITVNADGVQGDDRSWCPSINADGQYVAFYSFATNLVDGDTNNSADMFVVDMETGIVTRVSVGTNGEQGDGDSDCGTISANGRYVTFESIATTFDAADTNGTWDVYVKDLWTGELTLVSTNADGVVGDNMSAGFTISEDGRYVSFVSAAGNLVNDDTGGFADVFVKDLWTGAVARVSVNNDGEQGNYHCGDLSLVGFAYFTNISESGYYVGFISAASNLVEGDTNGVWDVFLAVNPLAVYDVSPPSVTIDAPAYSNGTQSINVLVIDDESGVLDNTLVYLDVDWNGDGDFEGAGELGCATTEVMSGAATMPLENLEEVEGVYSVRVRAADEAGNEGVSEVVAITFDYTDPTVTVNQAVAQDDPTGELPLYFTVVFSEEVCDFTADALTFSGTAAVGAVIVTGSGTTYEVAVLSVAQAGDVVVAIEAGAVHDLAGNGNIASTSADNSVTVEVAAGLVVTTAADVVDARDDETSLREAIMWANTHEGDDTITFAANLSGATITLALGELTIADTTGIATIQGLGAEQLTVSGDNTWRVLSVAEDATAIVSGLTITKGYIEGRGGGIANYGVLTVSECSFTENFSANVTVTEEDGGGAIFNDNYLTVISSSFTANIGLFGGAIASNYEKTLVVDGCEFVGNLGVNGGAICTGGTTTVTDSAFTENAADYGGGLCSGGGALTITDCTISDNVAYSYGAGVFAMTTLTISGSTFTGNESGASGGGVYNGGQATLVNCTLSGNAAGTDGGGVYNSSAASGLVLTNCTISTNGAGGSGGGLYGGATLSNTIVADNSNADDTAPDISGSVTANSCLVGDSSGVTFSSASANNLLDVDALLGELGDYGGATQTIALLAGSPAINAGDNSLVPSDVTTDQRGVDRILYGTVDMGAFEYAYIPVVELTVPAKTDDQTPSFTVSVTEGGATAADDTPVYVDIDMNGDGDFDDGGELGVIAGVTLDGSVVLTVSSPLADGTYRVRARALNQAGEVGVSAVATMVVDFAPDVSNVVVALTAGTPVITWRIVDSAGIYASSITVDGVALRTFGPYGTKYAANYAGVLNTLTAGEHVYVITATNVEGYTTRMTDTFTVAAPADNGPVISSVVEATGAASPMLTWRLTDESGVTTVTVTIDGVKVNVFGPYGTKYAGNYGVSLKTVSAGSHEYVITATNADGASTVYTDTLTMPGSGPTISSIVVAASASTPVITWRLTDDEGVASTTLVVDNAAKAVYGPYGTKYAGNYAGALGALDSGTHSYVITATNSQGVSSAYTGSFVTGTVSGPQISSIVVAASASTPVITWRITDGVGVSTTALVVDSVTKAVFGPYGTKYAGNYSGLLGTLAAGSHSYVITATNADGENSQASGNFTVAQAAAIAAALSDNAVGSAKSSWLFDEFTTTSDEDAVDAVFADYA